MHVILDAAAIVEGRLRRAIGRRRMEAEIQGLEDHIVLCGYGRLGQMTADELVSRGVDFVILDNLQARGQKFEEKDLACLTASGVSPASPRIGSSSAITTNSITPRKKDASPPSTRCGIGRTFSMISRMPHNVSRANGLAL